MMAGRLRYELPVVGHDWRKNVKNLNVFAVKAAGVTSLALLLTTSAFAETRHQDGTSDRGDRVGRSRAEQPSHDANRGTNEAYRRDGANNQQYRNRDANRGTTDANRGTNDAYRNGNAEQYRNNQQYRNNEQYRNRDANRGTNEAYRNRGNEAYRGAERGRVETRGGYNRGYSHRDNERVFLRGSISRYAPEHGGYRIWVGGGDSFWVPEAYWRSRGWRVGLSINLGGIFRGGSVWIDDVPYGYGGYYGADPYYAGGYGNVGYDNGYVRGVIDRVDYRRGTLLLRDDSSGRVIEVDMRADRYGRLNLDDLRPGDYVELSGGWVRGDIFAADRVDTVRNGRY
jgi:hypothetical protein